MADSFWVWSHGHKVREPDKADPRKHRFTIEQLDAMTDMEQLAAFIGRWTTADEEDQENFSLERMAYIIKHGLQYERVLIGHPAPNGLIFKTQYTRVLLDAARAVEFKMRFYNFSLEGYL